MPFDISDKTRIRELEQQMYRLVTATDEIQRKNIAVIQELERKVYELQHVVAVMVKVLRPDIATAHMLPAEEGKCH